MSDYILLYGEKKLEDNICIKNMFKNTRKINLGWIDLDYVSNMKIIDEEVEKGIKQIIFFGMEIGWKKLIKDVKEKYNDIKIKVICNTSDSLLYYDYERNNFFDLLELSKMGIISQIAFLRKGQYSTYSKIGYNCCYLKENYVLTLENGLKKENNNKSIGIYPLNYTWDKNIFNQLCIAKFIDNSLLNYNRLDERMEDFLATMKIKSSPVEIKEINEENIAKEIIKNDVIIATTFTEYFHPVFFISMELGIPCLVGNTVDFWENENNELRSYLVTETEDNPIVNAEKIKRILSNKEKILELYANWKKQYNKEVEKNINEFLNI